MIKNIIFVEQTITKTIDMVTKLELLNQIYNDIMDDYIPTPEVTEALEAVRELAKKLENL